MNNVINCSAILDDAQKKGFPFLNVGEGKPQKGDVELFPIKKVLPIKVYELGEMDNKLRLYMKGADGELFKLYVGALRSINEILRLELELAQEEAKNA